MMMDAGLVLYVGLLLVWPLRWITWWKHRKTNWIYLNYAFILYTLVTVLLGYALYLFIRAAMTESGKASWAGLPGWLRPMMIGAPVSAVFVLVASGAQTIQHVNEIRQDRAIVKHDRAIQIVVLPAVYGAMAMNSFARLYQLITQDGTATEADVLALLQGSNATASNQAKLEMYLSKSETCFWVGDLYEAWALFQFAKLTLELIQASVARMQLSPNPSERDKAAALAVAHSAVEAIAWLGVMLFFLVCILQAGWSVYLLTFTGLSSDADWSQYSIRTGQFGAAGMVASAGAIYNVHIVESTFHHYFESYRPLLKFITVKIIVSFAFFQKGIFHVLKAFQSTLPGAARRVSNKVPLLGTILQFSEVEFQLFYDSLMLYECVLICFLHWWGWSAYEDWYLDETIRDEDEVLGDAEEKRPLLDKPSNEPASPAPV
mmetsp:Transcript_98724/g.240147  ORF Transcript_98724/g.240147 Transcript_98724/m.240147 type:complete len:432 (-) Transcript_98724:70-1365(-)